MSLLQLAKTSAGQLYCRSAFTQVGPYMELISNVGWTPLSRPYPANLYGRRSIITTASAHGVTPGDQFTIDTAAGTGSFAALNGTFIATAGTTGSTLNFTIVTGLTMTITGQYHDGISKPVSRHNGITHQMVEAGNSTNYPLFSALLHRHGQQPLQAQKHPAPQYLYHRRTAYFAGLFLALVPARWQRLAVRRNVI